MEQDHPKTVLMIAFHYPPDHTSSGFLRTLKFTKYLPGWGWRPTVLTVAEEHYENRDPASLAQIPCEAVIRRTRAINTKKALSIRGKYLQLLAIPDRYVGWLAFAVPTGLSLIRAHGIRALYSTSPLPSAHLIAWTLKRLTGLPWIADFRDPWTEPEIATAPRGMLFRLDSRLEALVLRNADKLIFTTAQLRDYVLAHIQQDVSRKAIVIPNGYDEEDFSELPCFEPLSRPIRIIHTGLVDESYRCPRPFLDALAELLRTNQLSPKDVAVDFLGGGTYLQSPAFASVLRELHLENVVKVQARVSYAECLQQQLRSHILLLLQTGDDTRTLIPAKAFEYLRIGRPILAIVPKSASSELFAQVGGARIADPGDRNGILEALREMVRDAEVGTSSLKVSGKRLQE